MIKKWPSKAWVAFAAIVLALVLSINFLGQIFFLNHTQSMTRGLYVKIPLKKLEKGDTVVFKNKSYNGSLIKFVAGTFKDKYCFDEFNTLWVDGFPVAEINRYKYPNIKLNNSGCWNLQKGELLVVGDHPDSYDSRYFGPIKEEEIIAKAKLLWSND